MINIELYTTQLIDLLKHQFQARLLYVGLQGSYLRGEATSDSDLDIMVILESLTVADLDTYRTIIHSLDYAEKSCGFICSKEDLANWNPLEIHNLLNSTKDYYGKLLCFTPSYTKDDIRNFVKLSTNNLYHELCHRRIHGKRQNTELALPNLYKSVFFILQNLHALRSGIFPATKRELIEVLDGRDRTVLQRSIDMKKGLPFSYDDNFHLLFTWCQETLQTL